MPPTVRDAKKGQTLPPGPEVGPGEQLTTSDPDGRIAAPATALRRLQRGEAHMRREEPRWQELWAHFDGDQYVEVSAVDNNLVAIETREGQDKPRYRSRLVRNRLTRSIVAESSALTSRFPSYDVAPTNRDPDVTDAANIGRKCLIHLHDKLKLRATVADVVLNAAVSGDGYAWARWDGSKGNPIIMPQPDPETGEQVPSDTGLREGEIQVDVLRQDQVIWEPGVKFEDSPWWIVRLVKHVDDVKSAADYIGPADLKADARQQTIGGRHMPADSQLVFEYHYLERPTSKFAQGRWLTIVSGLLVKKPATYPCKEDRPVIFRFPWIDRGTRRERSLGAGEQVIDIQRSINRIVNQIVTWRNLSLVPQVFLPEGSLPPGTVLNEEPGKVIFYRGNVPPVIAKVPDIPPSLYQDLQQCYADMAFIIGAAGAVPTGVESGSGLAELNSREESYRAMQIGNLATFYADLGRQLLYLVAEHYTEDRVLEVNGRFGTERFEGFRGTILKKAIAAVRVSEASIAPRTRESQEAKIMMFADKGWITPQKALTALNDGTADSIIDDYELDVARVHRQIQAMIDLGKDPDLERFPEGRDPGEMIPEARPYDNHAVAVDEITQWMKTVDFERQPALIQAAAMNWLAMHEMEQMQEAMQEAQQVTAQAEALGTENAGGKPGEKPMPSRPSVAHEAAALQGKDSPNQ